MGRYPHRSQECTEGAGFFLGGAMLGWLGFAPALWTMAGALLLTLLTCVVALPREIGRAKESSVSAGCSR